MTDYNPQRRAEQTNGRSKQTQSWSEVEGPRSTPRGGQPPESGQQQAGTPERLPPQPPERQPTVSEVERREPSHLEPLPTRPMIRALEESRPWMRLLSVVGYVLAGFFLLGAVLIAIAALGPMAAADPGATLLLAFLYLVFAGLFFVPSWRLQRYIRAIAETTRESWGSEGTSSFEAALGAQRAFWRSAGVAVLVIIGLWLFFMLGAAGAFGAVTLVTPH